MASIKSYNHPKGSSSRTGTHAQGYTKATKAFIQGLKRGVKVNNRQVMKFIAEGRVEADEAVMAVFIAQP